MHSLSITLFIERLRCHSRRYSVTRDRQFSCVATPLIIASPRLPIYCQVPPLDSFTTHQSQPPFPLTSKATDQILHHKKIHFGLNENSLHELINLNTCSPLHETMSLIMTLFIFNHFFTVYKFCRLI